MKIYLAGGFTVLLKPGRNEELLEVCGERESRRLCSYYFKREIQSLLDLKRKMANENILGGEGRKKRA